MAARGLDLRRLRGAEKARVHEVFDAKPILAEPAGASGVVLWLFVVVMGVLILAIASWRDWGVVTQWQSIGVLGWTAYAIGGALIARGAVGARGAMRRPSPEWPCGRFVFPCGFVEARGSVLRVLPVEDFESSTVNTGTGNQIVLHTIELRFAGAAVERFHVATVPGSTVAPRLGELDVARDAVRAGRDLDRYQLVAAGTPPPRPPWSKRRAWLVAACVGLAVQAGAYLWLLPSRSVAAAAEWNAPERWTAIESAFPFGWVADRAAAGTATVYADARTQVRTRIHDPAVLEAMMAAIDELERQHTTTIGVSALLEDPHELDTATARLRELDTGEVAPVVLHGVDDNRVAGYFKLLDGTGLTFGAAIPDRSPVVRASVHVHAGTGIRFDNGRLYAGLAVDLDAVLAAGDKDHPFGGHIAVPAPTNASVLHYVSPGNERRPIGPGEDILVYQQMFDRQLDLAGAELARRLGAP